MFTEAWFLMNHIWLFKNSGLKLFPVLSCNVWPEFSKSLLEIGLKCIHTNAGDKGDLCLKDLWCFIPKTLRSKHIIYAANKKKQLVKN